MGRPASTWKARRSGRKDSASLAPLAGGAAGATGATGPKAARLSRFAALDGGMSARLVVALSEFAAQDASGAGACTHWHSYPPSLSHTQRLPSSGILPTCTTHAHGLLQSHSHAVLVYPSTSFNNIYLHPQRPLQSSRDVRRRAPATMQHLPATFQHVSEPPISTREPPGARDWLAVQGIVQQLYVIEKLPLRDVKSILEREYNFRNASERMFKSRLKAWGYLKNAKKDDWGAIALLHDKRKRLGKRSSVFTVRGRQRTVKDLLKYIRSLNMTEDEFLRSLGDQEEDIPHYIRAETPMEDGPGQKDSPSGSSTQEFTTPSPGHPQAGLDASSPIASPPGRVSHHPLHQRTSTYYTPPDVSGSASISESSIYQSHTSIFSSDSHTTVNTTPEVMSMVTPCDQLDKDLEAMALQMISPAPLPVRYGSEDIETYLLITPRTPDSSSGSSPDFEVLCSRCRQPMSSSQHLSSLCDLAMPEPPPPPTRSLLNTDDLDSPSAMLSAAWQLPASTREHSGAVRWGARCFLACIVSSRGDTSFSVQVLQSVSTEFANMVQNHDPMLLTAAQQVASILAMHDQGNIALTIMRASYKICERLLPKKHYVRTVMALWTAIAKSGGFDESGITCDDIKEAYQQCVDTMGESHQYSIAASYAWGFTLKMVGRNEEAEEVLERTYKLCCQVFGPKHMQSIFCLTGLANAQWPQGKYEEAKQKYEVILPLAKEIFGKHHPYTLEVMRRMGVLLREMEVLEGLEIPSQRVEHLYWASLQGKVKVLGASHTYSIGMRDVYEELCIERCVWQDREAAVKKLFGEDDSAASGKIRSASTDESETGSPVHSY